MRYLLNNSTDPYFNMALDEFCLENPVCEEPFFYLWRNRPSVIIGLNQNAWSEVNLEYLREHGITLARRVTGGGAVYHDLQNLNYSIVGSQVANGAAAPYASRPVRVNGRGSELPPDKTGPDLIAYALRQMGVPAELTGRNDIFVEGRKVSGYARRVSGGREIIHGTLMYDVDLETLTHVLDAPGSKLNAKGIASVRSRVANLKEYLPGFASLDEVQAALQEILAGDDEKLELTESQLSEVKKMAKDKFSTWNFIYGRSRQATITRKATLPCGTVEAAISLDRGLITEVIFTGDFLFEESPETLSKRLIGSRYDRTAICAVLEGSGVPHYFHKTSENELLSLLIP